MKLTYPPQEIKVEKRKDGTLILSSPLKLEEAEVNIYSRFKKTCDEFPNNIWLAEREDNKWRKLTYGAAYNYINSISQYLVNINLNQNRGIMILSGNSVDHGLLNVAGLCSGIPVAPISVAYSLMSSDHAKLKHCFELVLPGLIYVEDGIMFEKALESLPLDNVIIVCSRNPSSKYKMELFKDLLSTAPDINLSELYTSVKPEYVAKYLFTSGSTGMPKGVINTQKMLCVNMQQAQQVRPQELGETIIIDWLPWNHTMGGNHSFNGIFWNGGTMYIDGGKPVPALFPQTVENLKNISPTYYGSVPAGLAMLLEYLKTDKTLRISFFKNLVYIAYGGASLPPEVWYGIRDLAKETTGKDLELICGWGATETAPLATSTYFKLDKPGNIGLPIPGMKIKMVPVGNKMELRLKGPNVTPGYLKRDDLTKKAFDEEGYYLIGDAGRLVDKNDPSRGIDFDGRVVENFKLLTGTWVDVGSLRLAVVNSCSPLLQDGLVTGHDKNYLGFLAWPNIEACKKFIDNEELEYNEIIRHPLLIKEIIRKLIIHNKNFPGSSTRIKKVILMDTPPSFDDNEITDKGYVNQSSALAVRDNLVSLLYEESDDNDEVILIS
jgi:feruloyl-CoA synthase